MITLTAVPAVIPYIINFSEHPNGLSLLGSNGIPLLAPEAVTFWSPRKTVAPPSLYNILDVCEFNGVVGRALAVAPHSTVLCFILAFNRRSLMCYLYCRDSCYRNRMRNCLCHPSSEYFFCCHD